MNAILRYYGAKWRIAKWIISYMPPHHVYLEPYAGSCAILLNKPESKLETINDIDGNVVNFFKVLRNHPEELARAVNLTPWARDEFIATREEIDVPLERARRFAVACWMGRGSRISGSKTGFRRSTSGKEGSHSARQWDRVPDRLIDAANRLKCVQIENRDALQLIQEHNLPECLIYADPPYIGDGRTCKNEYKYEMTEADHRAQLTALDNHAGMVMLSGYDNTLYSDMLSSWVKIEKTVRADKAILRTECLWLNQPAHEKLRQVRLDAPNGAAT